MKAILKIILKIGVRKLLNHALSWMTSCRKKFAKIYFLLFSIIFYFLSFPCCVSSKNHQVLFAVIYRNTVNNIYQKIVNFTELRNVVLTSSTIIHHFENSQLIFTWHNMASMCAKSHCHTISSLENTRLGHFCPAPPPPPNKICYPRYPK